MDFEAFPITYYNRLTAYEQNKYVNMISASTADYSNPVNAWKTSWDVQNSTTSYLYSARLGDQILNPVVQCKIELKQDVEIADIHDDEFLNLLTGE